MSPTATLARFLASAAPSSAPPDAFASAKRTLVDTLGVALAGITDPVVNHVDQWAAVAGSTSVCTVWGRTSGASIADAALVNGVRAHALDFDDSLPSLNGHPSAVLWPAILAVAESTNATGHDTLWAYILGLEVAGKLGRAVGSGHYTKGWHPTATVGVFAATAAAGRLWHLSADQMEIALGIAASQACGLICNFGSMTKPLHVGQAARNGVMSAFLAKSGFTASPSVMDGKRSFIDIYSMSDGEPISTLVKELGVQWEISRPGIYAKRWPCCYCTYRPIGGVLELLDQHDITADNIIEIRVGFPPGTADALILATPKTGASAKFSTAYVLAALILDRRLSLDTFSDSKIHGPEVRRLMEKITSYDVPDSRVYNANVGYADLMIKTKIKTHQIRVERTPGSPDWPMTDADLKEKFLLCCEPIAGRERSDEILSTVERCDSLSSIKKLMSLLAFKPLEPRELQ